MDPARRIDAIESGLAELRARRAARHRVRRWVGRNLCGHPERDRSTHPVSGDELTALEEYLGVPLPADFRSYLSRIGWGDPVGYGVLSPAGIRHEVESDREVLAEVAVTGEPYVPPHDTRRPFPFTAADVRTQPLVAHWPIDGAAVIASRGCEFHTALVLHGELAGSVWDVRYGYDEPFGWWPADTLGGPADDNRGQVSAPVDFLSWIERALHAALARTA